jgi:hypothetical protein
MKQVIIKIILIVLTILLIIGLFHRINVLNNQLSNSINNEKAYAAENSNLRDKNLVYKLSIEQMKYFQDSLMIEMKKVANENGIKDKHIKSLQYQLEHFSKKDTIVLRDTIFRDPTFHLDTCLVDEWNNTCLSLSYPGNIGISNSYKNEKFIIVNSKRENIKPYKCFIGKWFGKKHTILEIDVVDKNPYVETERQRFIEIID